MIYQPRRLIALIVTGFLLGCSHLGAHSNTNTSQINNKLASQDSVAKTSISKEALYRILVAEFAGRRNQLPIAVDNYLAVAKKSNDPAVAERATRIALYAKDFDSAFIGAKRWLQLEPNHMNANRILATLATKDKKFEIAEAAIKKIYQLSSSGPRGAFFQIINQMALDTGEIRGLLEIVKDIAPSSGTKEELYLTLAVFYYVERELDDAELYINKVLAIDSEWRQAVVFKARILFSQQRIPETLSYLKEALDKYPEERKLRVIYARLLMDNNHHTEAENQYLLLRIGHEHDHDILFSLTLIKIGQLNYSAADKYLTELDKLLPGNANVRFYQGYVDEHQNEYAKAIAHYKSVTDGSNYFSAQIQVAHLLTKLNKINQARSHLASITTHSKEQDIQLILAESELLTLAEQLDTAFLQLSEALKEHDNNLDILYARALLSAKLKRIKGLEADLRKILSIEPEHVRALNALGFSLAEHTDRYDEAMRLIKKAYSLEPTNPAIIDSLGWVYFRQGDYEKSLHYLKAAYKSSDDPEIAAHLIEALLKTGRSEKAKDILKQALHSEPDHVSLKRLQQQFDSHHTKHDHR